jgi:hypothetical protein
MGKAAPQAAPSKTSDEQALETLEAAWGDFYLIGHDDEHGWWAARRGVLQRVRVAVVDRPVGVADLAHPRLLVHARVLHQRVAGMPPSLVQGDHRHARLGGQLLETAWSRGPGARAGRRPG